MASITYSPAELLAMDKFEMGKHMSGGYGAAKMLKMETSIHNLARKTLDLTTNNGQQSDT